MSDIDLEKVSEKKCPGCGQSFKPRHWQVEDGPCGDGKLYCTECMWKNDCGCDPTKFYHEENDE